ncbi:MAG: chemotaxis protein CheW [Phormidesmis sp.]
MTDSTLKESLYLTFNLDETRYSISSEYLEEMFPLPEITLLPTASQDIIGVLNLRGDIVPILDPKLSLGYESSPYKTTDSVIVLKQSQLRIGLIVNSIGSLEARSTQVLDTSEPRLPEHLQSQFAEVGRKEMIRGRVQSQKAQDAADFDYSLWLLNEPEQWLRYVEIQPLISAANVLTAASQPASSEMPDEGRQTTYTAFFAPDATPEEHSIFQQRAYSLSQPIGQGSAKKQQDARSVLTIIAIEDTRFGVRLSAVKEFTEIQTVTPIPCCPPHIVGNMNLRGDILTLIDIRQFLNRTVEVASDEQTKQTSHPTSTPSFENSKVMVVELENCVAGILVGEVLEAMFPLRPQEMLGLSESSSPINQRYLQGEFSYRGTIVSILDLPKLLLQGDLDIDELV